MKPDRTPAFLLRTTPYREADLVVVLLTRRWGMVSALARGARKSRRRFGGALDYFHLLDAEVRPSRSGLGSLRAVELVRPCRVLRADVDAYCAGSHVLEVARLGSREGEPDEGLFGLVEASLGVLDRGADPSSAVRVFQARVLAVLGYEPALEACPACGAPLDGGAALAPEGVAVCAGCAGGARRPLSIGALRTAQAALGLPLDRLGTLRVSPLVDGDLGAFLEGALVAALGTRPKSMDALPVAGRHGR